MKISDKSSTENGSSYRFEGQHLLASYSACNPERLTDIEGLLDAFKKATVAAGATILAENHHLFPPQGLTALLLLSESHASLHTYPEHGSCFADLFTCGANCNPEIFHQLMQDYLKPQQVQGKTILRNTDVSSL